MADFNGFFSVSRLSAIENSDSLQMALDSEFEILYLMDGLALAPTVSFLST
jgi:hypothetical protein